ncbi:MAG: M48 family metalloprotease [Candidatus Hydrogenedentes bacterium]|nr:M48 family metalloprotease [Candidatus Hydrogenedentota bacterium]
MDHLDLQNTRWIDPPARLVDIASRIGVPVTRLGIVPNFLNAATDLRGTVWIGEPLLRQLSCEDIEAVVAHELAHATWFRTQAFQRTVLLAAMIWHEFSMRLRRLHPLLALICWQELGHILHWMLTPCRWSRECSADAVAAEVVGKERMQVALANLRQLRGLPDLPSVDHPPLGFRIACLSLN